MASELLAPLLEGLLASSAAVLLVLVLRPWWRRAFGPSAAPLLWSLVPAALLAVALPAPVVTGTAPWLGIAAPATAAPLVAVEAAAADGFGSAVLLSAWCAGALVSALWFAHLQRAFRRRLGTLRPATGRTCFAERPGLGPAVLGLLRPRIVLPPDFEQRYAPDQQAMILAHEHSHLRRGDVVACAIATGLRTLYWFNPLMHYAAACLRHDHELASDADVLRAWPQARRRYADTLLNVQLTAVGPPVGCLWTSSPLKERILMLRTSATTTTRRRFGVATGAALTLGVATLAWASQPPRIDTAAAAWADTRITIEGADSTLRAAVQNAVSAAGARVQGAELLDAHHPRADIDYSFNDTPAGKAVQIMLEDTSLQYSLDARGVVLAAAPQAGGAQPEQGAQYRTMHAPAYPKAAIDDRQQGQVILRVLVAADGTPREIAVETSSTAQLLDAAAVDAVRGWEFDPAVKKGAPVDSWVLVPICFSLAPDAAPETVACEAPEGALEGVQLKAPAQG